MKAFIPLLSRRWKPSRKTLTKKNHEKGNEQKSFEVDAFRGDLSLNEAKYFAKMNENQIPCAFY